MTDLFGHIPPPLPPSKLRAPAPEQMHAAFRQSAALSRGLAEAAYDAGDAETGDARRWHYARARAHRLDAEEADARARELTRRCPWLKREGRELGNG